MRVDVVAAYQDCYANNIIRNTYNRIYDPEYNQCRLTLLKHKVVHNAICSIIRNLKIFKLRTDAAMLMLQLIQTDDKSGDAGA